MKHNCVGYECVVGVQAGTEVKLGTSEDEDETEIVEPIASPLTSLHDAIEQMEQPGVDKFKSRRMVDAPREEMTHHDTFCLKSMAGELRWLESRDVALDRRILAEARKMEDRHFEMIHSEKARELELELTERDENMELQRLKEKFLLEEGLNSCTEDELMLNQMMDRMMEEGMK